MSHRPQEVIRDFWIMKWHDESVLARIYKLYERERWILYSVTVLVWVGCEHTLTESKKVLCVYSRECKTYTLMHVQIRAMCTKHYFCFLFRDISFTIPQALGEAQWELNELFTLPLVFNMIAPKLSCTLCSFWFLVTHHH